MSSTAVTVAITSLTELAKLGLQIYFASTRQAGLTEEECDELLLSERQRFDDNIRQPLPDVE